MISISIIGVGVRGGDVYGKYIYQRRKDCTINALCDISKNKLKKYGDLFEVKEENRFLEEKKFFEKRRSDALIISTPDKKHIGIAMKAMELGYHILLETPVSDDFHDLTKLSLFARKTGKMIMLANILRYSTAIRKLKEIIGSGKIGSLVSIDYTENVGFWHAAHSYVRGNWRKAETSTPMIMAKCCHDFDILLYLTASNCKAVSSFGSLAHFKKENAPNDASDRCVSCVYIETCPYSAKKIYIDLWEDESYRRRNLEWPMNALTSERPITTKVLYKAIETGDYGRCVYKCDNDVVDNQRVIMEFENGVSAVLKMESFVKYGGRTIRVFGSKGEVEYDERENLIREKLFFGEDNVWKGDEIVKGNQENKLDSVLLDDFLKAVASFDKEGYNIGDFTENHFMALAAEESRRNGGKVIDIFKFRNGDGLIKNILEYIEANYLEDITIKSVSKKMGYSVGYCSKLLRDAVGENFRDYLNRKRLKKAEELSLDKTLNLTKLEILYQSGFKSPSTFYRASTKLKEQDRKKQ